VCAVAVTITRSPVLHFVETLLFTYHTGYDVYNSIVRWHPALIDDPTYIRDPASIRSFTVVTKLAPRVTS